MSGSFLCSFDDLNGYKLKKQYQVIQKTNLTLYVPSGIQIHEYQSPVETGF
ncbi:MAG: hypothetical protein KME59_00450 [Trichormus sp. ATA11-4-KO1]|jgi:hypothetical protein|nr:hypothetical protein [Trichormus sp. ATA11-4-KO1]